MNPDDYTDDAVCFAMGVGPFAPADEGGGVLRLLCKPSFHPEACVTLTPNRVVSVALRSMLWHELVAARLPEYAAAAALSADEYRRCSSAFSTP